MLLSAFGLPVLDQIKYHRLRRDRLHKDLQISTMLWLVAHEVEGAVVVELELDAPPRIAWSTEGSSVGISQRSPMLSQSSRIPRLSSKPTHLHSFLDSRLLNAQLNPNSPNPRNGGYPNLRRQISRQERTRISITATTNVRSVRVKCDATPKSGLVTRAGPSST